MEPLDVMWQKHTDTQDLGPYDVRCDFDLNGRVDSSDDTVCPGWDWHLTNDTRGRLVIGDRGTLSGAER